MAGSLVSRVRDFFAGASEREKTAALLLLALTLYLPFVSLGFGSDFDSYRLVHCATRFIHGHGYRTSRYPGYFLYEMILSFLLFTGQSCVYTNLSSVLISLVGLFFFMKILRVLHAPHPHLLTLMLIVHPIYWVNSTCTIDYIWALTFIMIGCYLFLTERGLAAGLFLGLAIDARLSSIVFVFCLALATIAAERRISKKVIVSATAAGLLGAIGYVPIYYSAGHGFKFLTYYIGQWSLADYLGRFIYKNIYFWGLQTVLAAGLALPLAWKRVLANLRAMPGETLLLGLLLFAAFELLFLKMPIENEYMLPMLPFLLVLAGFALRDRPRLLWLFFLLILSYDFISLNIARPDHPYNAKTAHLGPWWEPGYLVSDARERLSIWFSGRYINWSKYYFN